MEPIAIIKEFGFYAATMLALGFFLRRDVWPFCMRQIETRYSDSQLRHMKMLAIIENLTEQVTAQRAQSIEALHTLAIQMTELTQSVNNLSHLVSVLSDREEHRHLSHRQP